MMNRNTIFILRSLSFVNRQSVSQFEEGYVENIRMFVDSIIQIYGIFNIVIFSGKHEDNFSSIEIDYCICIRNLVNHSKLSVEYIITTEILCHHDDISLIPNFTFVLKFTHR